MDGLIRRMIMVRIEIQKLPAEVERRRASKLYDILSRLEQYRAYSVYLGLGAAVGIFFAISYFKSGAITITTWPDFFYSLLALAIFTSLSAFLLRRFIFNHFRDRRVSELTRILQSDPSLRLTLRWLKKTDPAMIRSIGSSIKEAERESA